MSDKIKELEKEIESLKDAKTIIEMQIEKTSEKLNELRKEKRYFINVFGEVEETKGLRYIDVVCMENQGNVFDSYADAVKESQKRLLKKTIEKFRNECNEDWKPNWANSNEEKFYINFEGSVLSVKINRTLNILNMFGYFKNKSDCEKAIEIYGDSIIELYND